METHTNGSQPIDYSKLICLECRENPIYLTPSGKPVGEDSKYYGLCKECKRKKAAIIMLEKNR